MPVQHWIHELLSLWFHWVEAWGYWGVFLLMAMESSIIPVPSEVVLPPAAFWAAQGKMNLPGVILAGTLGSIFGSFVSYFFARWLGQPLLRRYGHWVFLPAEKLNQMEAWALAYGTPGIFFSRLLPVVRHLISLPAGALRMPLLPFCVATSLGAGLWCALLSWIGQEVLGAHPELLDSPEAMVQALKAQSHTVVLGIGAFAGLYALVFILKKRANPQKKSALSAPS